MFYLTKDMLTSELTGGVEFSHMVSANIINQEFKVLIQTRDEIIYSLEQHKVSTLLPHTAEVYAKYLTCALDRTLRDIESFKKQYKID